uniref:THO complex subunit 7 n=1 Tax=Eptatretus burgeri TaxID=7764 RepID=A0A8C4Q6F9_EPTBU
MALSSGVDDEIIRKRLLIDGDGGGDDRRINTLFKSCIKWCHSDSSAEESAGQLQRMLVALAQCEFAMGKTVLGFNMNQCEMKMYEENQQKIEESINAAHEKMGRSKQEIQQAKRIRKNRQEYDALAKVIETHPDRSKTLRQLEDLQKELEHLSRVKESFESKLEMRRKQFHALLSCIHELQHMLDYDEKASEKDGEEISSMEISPQAMQ